MGFSGCKNWLEESYNCTQNEAGDVEIKRLQNCEQNEEKWKILTRTPRRREYLYLVGRADGDSPRVGRVVECHVEVTDLWGFKGRICEGGRPTLCEFVHTTSRHFRSEY